ncbi:MAG: ACP S-malonyltransferase [Vicinamibacteria bacterium]|nr:ACP S-malonyltransferase [Vicinamibacteria bacterium]
MKIAFIFPGQGSQRVGMGFKLKEAFAESRETFDTGDRVLGFALSKLCFEGPEEELQLTANTQPAILASSIAAYRPLAKRGVRPAFVAGHSLGEYSALVAAGALGLEDALETVRLRGQFMQEAVPVGEGAMAAILGLDTTAIQKACTAVAETQIVQTANINCPGQVVIAGHVAAVERAMEACKKAGARRAVRLPVSAPFHCLLMRPAQERLAARLDHVAIADPAVPLVSNVDARVVRSGTDCRDGLIRQVSAPVRWQESIELMAREGVETFVEIGPGGVLAGLVRKTNRQARVLNVEDPETLEKTAAILSGSAAD